MAWRGRSHDADEGAADAAAAGTVGAEAEEGGIGAVAGPDMVEDTQEDR